MLQYARFNFLKFCKSLLTHFLLVAGVTDPEEIYVPRWTVKRGSLLASPADCRGFMRHAAPTAAHYALSERDRGSLCEEVRVMQTNLVPRLELILRDYEQLRAGSGRREEELRKELEAEKEAHRLSRWNASEARGKGGGGSRLSGEGADRA